jgi:hypothetical protein
MNEKEIIKLFREYWIIDIYIYIKELNFTKNQQYYYLETFVYTKRSL